MKKEKKVKAPKAPKKQRTKPIEEDTEENEDMSNHAFNKLLTQKMKERGISFEEARDKIESGALYGEKEPGEDRPSRSLNGWLKEKELRDWLRACGARSDEYDSWS